MYSINDLRGFQIASRPVLTLKTICWTRSENSLSNGKEARVSAKIYKYKKTEKPKWLQRTFIKLAEHRDRLEKIGRA